MSEIHALPIIDGSLWVVEQDGEKIATLRKQENNKFLLSSNYDNKMWFNKQEDVVNTFGETFFLKTPINNKQIAPYDCHGFVTKDKPYNAMYDVKRKLPLFTKSKQSKSLYCAGWYTVKFKNWVLIFCPKLVTIDQYESHGPFHTKLEAKHFKCNIK
jgi:hypothetical protein